MHDGLKRTENGDGNVRHFLLSIELLQLFLVTFMVKVEKDYGVVGQRIAVVAFLFEPGVFSSAKAAPIVDEPVIPTANVFFVTAMIKPLHFAIGIRGIVEQTVDNFPYSQITGRIKFMHLIEFTNKMRHRPVAEPLIFHAATYVLIFREDNAIEMVCTRKQNHWQRMTEAIPVSGSWYPETLMSWFWSSLHIE